MMVETHSTFF